MKGQVRIRVRYAETDRMGVAHHAAYFAWFEEGRSALLRESGRSYADVEEEDGLYLPVIEAHARYHRPAHYDQLLGLETWVERLDRVRLTFAYRLTSEQGDLLAEAQTRHALLDEGRRPVPLPDWLRQVAEPGPSAEARPRTY